MGSAFIKKKIVFRNFIPRQLLITCGVFPLPILACLLMWQKPAKQSLLIKTVKAVSCQCPKGDSAAVYRSVEHDKMSDGWKPATIYLSHQN